MSLALRRTRFLLVLGAMIGAVFTGVVVTVATSGSLPLVDIGVVVD